MSNEMERKSTSLAEETKAQAKAYFREGLNCAECVFLAFLDTHETNLPREVVGLASGFGGGIGHTKHMCGAISGALLALGTQKGRPNPFEKESPKERALQLREEVYPRFAALLNEVKEQYGTILCAELTAKHPDFDAPARKKSCAEMVAYCAELCARHAEKGE